MQVLNNNYNLYVDLSTCIFSMLLLFLLLFSYNKKDYQYKILCTANICTIIAGVSSIIYNTIIFNMKIEIKPIEMIVYITHHLSNIAMICIWVLILLYLYTIAYYKKMEKTRKRTTIICTILMIIYTFVEIFGTITKTSFYIKDGIAYEHFFFNVFNVFYLFYAFCVIFCYIRYRKKFPPKTFFYICILMICCFSIVTICAIMQTTTFNVLTFFLPILYFYILFHGEKFNIETGTLGIEAFNSFISSLIKKDTKFVMISLFIINNDGLESNKLIFNDVANICNAYFKNKTLLFKKNSNILNIIIKGEFNSIIENTINDCFKEIKELNLENSRDIKLVVFNYDKETFGKVELKQITDFNKFLISKAPINKVYIQTKKDYDIYIREDYIKNELININYKKDLNDERVLVFCQPISNIEKTYKNAEVLMRLNLPRLGIVSPLDFIPMAEKLDLIHTLSLIILNKVCIKIKELLKENYEINRFSINFSAQEFDSDTFYEEVTNIIDSVGIPYDKLAFEITETSFIKIEKLNDIMNKLKEKGIIFYLDDFGTGYSNIDKIVTLPFSTIKFDRSLVLSSKEKTNSKFIVKNLCEIFKEMKLNILFEGIETEKEEDMCMSMGAEYLQGYKYSRPIPIENIKNYLSISKKNK